MAIDKWGPDERLERGPGLRVPQALLEDHLLTLYRRQKVRQLSGGDAKLLIVSLLTAAQLGACQLDLAFRPTREPSVVFGDTAHPAFTDEGIGNTCVERVVADRHLGSFDVGIQEGIRPVVQVVHLYPAAPAGAWPCPSVSSAA
jgi:hypothetical protein